MAWGLQAFCFSRWGMGWFVLVCPVGVLIGVAAFVLPSQTMAHIHFHPTGAWHSICCPTRGECILFAIHCGKTTSILLLQLVLLYFFGVENGRTTFIFL